MEPSAEDFNLHWEEVVIKNSPKHEVQEICDLAGVQSVSYSGMTSEEMIADTDQMAAENLMYLSQDVVGYTEATELTDDLNVECVTEEVITDDWVIAGGQERVEVPLEHLANSVSDVKVENDIDVPLPTDQDEYTAMRPWPCDFCSRRFRKKAALMNHMVAHQSDRPHACNLCGVRYVRKCDLMNHLKVHAFVPEHGDTMDYDDVLPEKTQLIKPKKKRGRRKKNPEPVENGVWENMTSARTQQWQRRARTPAPRSPSPASEPEPPPPPAPPTPPPPADPSRPFVCRHCGVGFAREKALQSHSRIHGGDSPVECGECGELCWSREALSSHTAHRHPHAAPRTHREPSYDESNSGDDMDFRLSPITQGGDRGMFDNVRGPELFCQDCGVAFQRVDLLRRHVAAAHSYKRHDSTSSTWAEHTCDVCGESCTDALQLLAHAEGHAERHRPAAPRLKRHGRGRNNTTSTSNSRQFPCRECGKVFGSRSSQQIHIRIHTGERPYACRFCWKAFADGGTLRKHERIHTGEKPYACAVCPRAFNQRVVLREHVRSHHSAPDRRANGGNAYCCVVCGRTLHSSVELVQHLIQHCDANTALKRQPQNGPRKYKRRRKLKAEMASPKREWEGRGERGSSPSGASVASNASRASERLSAASTPHRAPSPPRRAPSPPRRRRRRAPPAPPRPRMIHTEEPRPRTKQVRSRRPPRHPADDLRAIATHSASPGPASPSPPSPSSPNSPPSPASPPSPSSPQSPTGPYKCEMCSLEFPRRDALLLHVPVHI
ncbi:unnamed protein product, partial [Iphiclides podalirius]